MNLIELNSSYERWLRKQVPIIEIDLQLKHERMRSSPFPFLRASFFRWCDLWLKNMKVFEKAPKILCIGDLHIENYGTWRDLEGRLIWGINDFDEAYEMPYAIDLVRLGTSALIASSCDHLKLSADEIMQNILTGYEDGLRHGGRAFVLEECHTFLRDLAQQAQHEPKLFYQKIDELFPSNVKAPAILKKLLIATLPKGATDFSFAHRPAGLGSLGRARFIVKAQLNGGFVVREIKALAPAAYSWILNKPSKVLKCQKLIESSVRMPDPILSFKKNWVIRRLAPHCTKIEVSRLDRKLDELKLMHSMGYELANIHMKFKNVILSDFKQRKKSEWIKAVELMTELTLKDWQDWTKQKS